MRKSTCLRTVTGKSIAALIVAAVTLAESISAGAAMMGNVSEKRVLEEAASGANWFLKGGDFNGQHYSPLAQIRCQCCRP